uniref:Uncharacterized protein n=1 Tax=Physcomitrium patens TaxID=3218 RepID=A0A2K1KAX4_PHYPA|nr:hypothetical protein PHYPA_010114 [Physcomitrium patens]
MDTVPSLRSHAKFSNSQIWFRGVKNVCNVSQKSCRRIRTTGFDWTKIRSQKFEASERLALV